MRGPCWTPITPLRGPFCTPIHRQGRPLDACYPLVFFDAIRVKIRDEGFVRNKAVYIALGMLPDGTKEILGIWIEQTEGAKFWMRVMNELDTRNNPSHFAH